MTVPCTELCLKLDSGSDGAEVFEAFDSSRLIVSANSSSLARWDAKLGVQPHPFVAGLSSLSVDGGIIVLMDIIVDKIFPLAYTPADKSDREPPWDEGEERIRAEKWKVGSRTKDHQLILVRNGTRANRPGYGTKCALA